MVVATSQPVENRMILANHCSSIPGAILSSIITRGDCRAVATSCNLLVAQVSQLIPINAHSMWQPHSVAMAATENTRNCYSAHNCASMVSFSM